MSKNAVIIGAGPAGLTAAYELLEKTDIKPIIFEADEYVGGISRTIRYNGNRIDIGGHRFFSKSDRVMEWWTKFLPVQGDTNTSQDALEINYQNQKRTITLSDKSNGAGNDNIMLVRSRLSRIYYVRKFFDYPIRLSLQTVKNLGVTRLVKILLSYIKASLLPIQPEKNLEEFYINRFGRELYNTFFKDYTHKVWGVPCSEIGADWGAQRVKGLSIRKALVHALKSLWNKQNKSIKQKGTETSLIERFLYPKYGPGQMWEEVKAAVEEKGGELYVKHQVIGLKLEGNAITSVVIKNRETAEEKTLACDYVFSTMPVRELIQAVQGPVPPHVREIANGLVYRDFMTVGLLLNKLKVKNNTSIHTENDLIPDTWIYIQEPDVKVGRIQVFNNWSPFLVSDPHKVWIGMEYFVNEGDEMWRMKDKDFVDFAVAELERIGFVDPHDVLDSVVIRMKKTYPSYTGTFNQFNIVRSFTDVIENLFLIGRNGMHRYNNQDHSMLTAMTAVENIQKGIISKDNIWEVNTEQDYHEEKK